MKEIEMVKKVINKDSNNFSKWRFCLLLSVFCLLFSVFCFLSPAYANNIKVTNCQVLNMSSGSTTADISFDVSWDNSWKFGTQFYDAAWVFAKISVNDGVWIHATITGVTSTGASGTGLTIDVPSDNKGAFLYRTTADSGSTLSTTGVKLQWARQSDGVAYNAAKVKVQVFAIEMVHIPTSSFYLGDGTGTSASGGSNSHFFDAASSSRAAVKITATQPYISTVSDGTGTAGDIAWADENGGAAGTLPATRTQLGASFPTGYNNFYAMKYEITQGQYRDFLNTLTRAQQINRVATSIASGTTSVTNVYVMSNTATVSYRNGIACAAAIPATTPVTFFCDLDGDGVGNESGDGEWLACTYLSWMNLCAYADWAALRPMTELEFEKACRGPKTNLANEYSWGTASATQATGISNAGTNSEVASNSTANCVYGNHASVQGIVRSGFASTATSTTRASAGASYYGIMELTGNAQERTVTIGNATGRLFNGANGDGALGAGGNANGVSLQYWPGYASGEITSATGAGYRGGSWCRNYTEMRTSDRYFAAYGDALRAAGSYFDYCGRLVRTQ